MKMSRLHSPALVSLPQLMDQVFSNSVGHTTANNCGTSLTKPAVNIKETDNGFQVEVLAPGIPKEEINIAVENETLTVSFDHKENSETTTKDAKFTRREFSIISFKRSFHIPNELVNTEGIKASHNNGILTIELPKKQAAPVTPAKTIVIE